MNTRGSHVRKTAAALMLLAAALPAAAQGVYRCVTAGGTYLSDRPCTAGAPAPLRAIGPPPQRPVAPSYIPPVGKAPEHLTYLSPACASLNDAIRTAPARGLKGQAINDLRAEYGRKCSEDESEAMQRLSRERNDERVARRNERAEQQAQQAQSAREREQCQELLRILHAKRQRFAAMTSGEQADFSRSEANYHARCGTR
jgi:hypothetical protein